MNRKNAFLQRRLGMEALGQNAPSFSVALGRAATPHDDYIIRLPFKRSAPVILIAFVFLAAFSVPLFTMGGFFAGEGDDSLFSLVFTLFSLFWMLGWSSGVLLLLLLFLCLVMGRETLHASRNGLTIRFGIPGIALAASYSPDLIRDFRYIENDIADSRKWRGQHIAFDYGGVDIGAGSKLDSLEAREIISRLSACFPLHDAAPVTAEPSAAEDLHVAGEKPADRVSLEASSRSAHVPVRWYSLTGIVLIAANLIPLAGVLLACCWQGGI